MCKLSLTEVFKCSWVEEISLFWNENVLICDWLGHLEWMASPMVKFQPGLLMLPLSLLALSPLSVDMLYICVHCIYCFLSVTHSWAAAFSPCACKAKIFAVRPFVRCSSPGLFSVQESKCSLISSACRTSSQFHSTPPLLELPWTTESLFLLSVLCCGCWYWFCQAVAQVEKTGSWGWKAFCDVCPSSVQ